MGITVHGLSLLHVPHNSRKYTKEVAGADSLMVAMSVVAIDQYRMHPDSRTTRDVPVQVIANEYALVGTAMKFVGSEIENLRSRLSPSDITAQHDTIHCTGEPQPR